MSKKTDTKDKKQPEVIEGRQIAEKDFRLPNGDNVTVRVVDCRKPKAPKVPKAKWGTVEFAKEVEYFETSDELRARIDKVLPKAVKDLVEFVDACAKAANAFEFWKFAMLETDQKLLHEPCTKLGLITAKQALDIVGTGTLVLVRNLVRTSLEAVWTVKKSRKAKKPAAKKEEAKA